MAKQGRLQLILGLGLFSLSFSHWFPLEINFLELLSAFAHITMAISVLIILVSIWKRYRQSTILSLGAFLLSSAQVIPQMLSSPFSNRETELTIGQFNLYHHNDAINESIETILLSQADVMSIQELNSRWSANLKAKLESSHPFTIEEPWDNCCYGIGLYSKFPIISHEIVHFDSIPAIVALLDVQGKSATVILLHTQAPAFPNNTPIRNAQINLTSQIVNQNDGPWIIAGDFNIVPWDGFFKRFLKQTGLKRVRNGLQPTYPMALGIPLVPIDHIMYSKELEPTSCQTVLIPGSDHKGLVAGFRFK